MTEEKRHVERLHKAAQHVADRLRGLAAEVEQEARSIDRVGAEHLPRYANVAEQIVQDVAAGFGKLRLERVVLWAGEADVARATTQAAESKEG